MAFSQIDHSLKFRIVWSLAAGLLEYCCLYLCQSDGNNYVEAGQNLSVIIFLSSLIITIGFLILSSQMVRQYCMECKLTGALCNLLAIQAALFVFTYQISYIDDLKELIVPFTGILSSLFFFTVISVACKVNDWSNER